MTDSRSEAPEFACGSEFSRWLASETGLAGRSLRDILYRAKRAAALADLSAPMTRAEVDFRLAEAPGFALCTPSVRSQLRRSARLYAQFLATGAAS